MAQKFRVPPQAIEVEKHIIGALFLDREAAEEAFKILKPEDFYLEKHEELFRSAHRLFTNRKEVDLISVCDDLKKNNRFDIAGGDSYLMEISSEVVSSANIGQHADIVRDKSLLRMVIQTATKILEGAYSEEIDAKDLVKQSGESLYKLEEAARGATHGLVDMRTAVIRASNHFQAVANGEIMRTRFGISAIDSVIQGFRKSSVNIVAARPGIGKSALLLQAAVSCGKPVPIFSMEMLIQEEIERMMAHIHPELNSNGVATQAQVVAHAALIAATLEKLSKYPIEICDETSPTIPYMRSEVRRMKRKYGELGFTLVDYLQMIKPVGKFERRDLAVASISEGLKEISHDSGAPVISAASLSRECEKRDNKRPVESDLRDAGQIESDAHCIIFLYKEAKYSLKAKKDVRVKDIIEVSAPKNRGGDVGRTLLDFKGAQSWFHPVSHDDQKYYHDFLRGKFMDEGEDPKSLARLPSSSPRGSRKPKTESGEKKAWDVDVPPIV
jgi:replicative DNA helicase